MVWSQAPRCSTKSTQTANPTCGREPKRTRRLRPARSLA
jgi:hypothetical protein